MTNVEVSDKAMALLNEDKIRTFAS